MHKNRHNIRNQFLSFVIGLTVFLFLYIAWTISSEKKFTEKKALNQAISSYDKDLVYRRWSSGHGGVYVPITDSTQPNPYLDIDDREITTVTGKKYTLINPAYMTRQAHSIQQSHYGIKGHITSLNPLNPINRPDTWEKEALTRIENGETEVYGIETINKKKYLRYIHGMITEKSCLKCHEQQGYKEGDIRGGISVTVPMEENYFELKSNITQHVLLGITAYLSFFIFGLVMYKKSLKAIKISEQSILELQNNEKKLQAFFNNSADAIYIHNIDGRILDANKKACSQLNYTKEELLKMTVMQLDANYPTIDSLRPFWESVDENGSVTIQSLHIKKDKTTIPVEISLSQIIQNEEKLFYGTVRDISERTSYENALKEINTRYKLLSESSFEGIAITLKGELVDFNKQITEMYGYSKEEFKSIKLKDLIHPEDLNLVIKNNAFNSHEPYYHRGIKKDGSVIYNEVRGKKIVLNNIEHRLTVIKDTTKSVMHNRIIKENEEKFRSLFDNTIVPITMTDTKGNILLMNNIAKQNHKIESDEYIGKSAIEVLGKEVGHSVINEAKIIAKTGKGLYVERKYHLSGKEYWFISDAQPIRDQNGQIIGISIIFLDITERKKAENELMESELRYKQLANLTLEGIILVKETEIFDVNPMLSKITGYLPEDLIGKKTDNQNNIDLLETLHECISAKSESLREIIIEKKDGTLIDCEIEWKKMKHDNNNITVISIRDISEKKQMEKNILKAVIEAEEKERSRFSQDLHDGLGPILSNIQMYFQWLTDDDENHDMVVEKGNSALNQAFKTLREISFNLSPHILRNFGLSTALNNFIENVAPQGKPSIVFKSNMKERLDENIEISSYRIITELINNSLKYAEATKIQVDINVANNFIYLDYEDNGKGFSQQEQEMTGLGIYNIRSRIKSLDGFCTIKSDKGKGLRFSAQVPV